MFLRRAPIAAFYERKLCLRFQALFPEEVPDISRPLFSAFQLTGQVQCTRRASVGSYDVSLYRYRDKVA